MKPENTIKLIKLVRILTIIFLILLAYLSIKYKFNSCQLCKFEYQGKTLDVNEVWNLYKDTCLQNFGSGSYLPPINYTPPN